TDRTEVALYSRRRNHNRRALLPWRLVGTYCAFVISINTTAGPGEIRHLRFQDIDVEKRIMRVQPEGAKNVHRIRPIPLSDAALEAVQYLWNRAQKLGSNEPAHYLLPYRVRTGVYDPTKPCKGWRTAHDALLKVCDID